MTSPIKPQQVNNHEIFAQHLSGQDHMSHDYPDLATQSDTSEKAAPVDTVRLKRDAMKDYDKGAKIQDAENRSGIYTGAELVPLESAVARLDSLNKARKGQIPVKKSSR